MKRNHAILLCLTFFYSSVLCHAQTYISMRPNWTFNTPIAKSNSLRYYVSKGTGNNEHEARNDAFAQIIKESQVQVGVSISSKNALDAFQKGDEINTIANEYNIPMREVCSFSEYNKGTNKYIYWYLVQMPIRGGIEFPFEPFEGDCYNMSKAQELRDLMKNEYKDEITIKRKQQAKEVRDQHKQNRQEAKELKALSNKYLSFDRNKYVAWGIVGTGYPWNLYSSIEFRYGKTVGIGAYLDLGLDFTHITVNQKYTCTKTMFGYAAGIKFFPYRGLFLSCGYGSIPTPSKSVTLDLSDWQIEHGSTDEMIDKAQKKAACDKVQQNNGLLVHAGYDLVTDLTSHAGFFLGINAGVSFDFANKVIAPSALIKFGVAWKY